MTARCSSLDAYDYKSLSNLDNGLGKGSNYQDIYISRYSGEKTALQYQQAQQQKALVDQQQDENNIDYVELPLTNGIYNSPNFRPEDYIYSDESEGEELSDDEEDYFGLRRERYRWLVLDNPVRLTSTFKNDRNKEEEYVPFTLSSRFRSQDLNRGDNSSDSDSDSEYYERHMRQSLQRGIPSFTPTLPAKQRLWREDLRQMRVTQNPSATVEGGIKPSV